MAKLWNQKGLPHKGWLLDGYEDIGECEHTCEMCGQTEIRYVHYMKHPLGHRVSVGCDCAQKMTEDYNERQKISDQNRQLKRRFEQLKRQKEKLDKFRQQPYGFIKSINLEYKQQGKFRCNIRRFEKGWRYKAELVLDEIILYNKSMFEDESKKWIDTAIKNYSKSLTF